MAIRRGTPGLITLTINGAPQAVPAEPERSLLVVLREELGLTGAKYGCAAGACGACTVLIDDMPARACITPAAEVTGTAVTTVEGLAPKDGLHPVQAAVVAAAAMQCGYCTPGMVLAAAALLAAHPSPDDAQIIRALDGNICRCCAYPRILTAVRRAAEQASLAPHGDGGQAHEAERPPRDAPIAAPAGGSGPSGARGGPPGGSASPRASTVPWDLLPPDERGYFDALGDGLVAVLPPGERPTGLAPWRRHGGAWIHVGADGVVSAFTGKVDVGQDNRTALAMLVAEELCVPLQAVRMVMGDTDVCPFDIGTFGSRSMPDAGHDLQVTAACARRALIGMTATAWETEPGRLSATGAAAVQDNSTGRTVSYAELLRGVQRTVTAGWEEPVTDRRAWRTAGQPQPNPDAGRAVRGAKRFTSDLSLPGMLHGKVLRPPAYGAALGAADLSGARSVPGVIAVREGSFVAVAGPDPVTAGHALGLIEAEWDRVTQLAEQDLAQHLRLPLPDAEGWAGPFHHEAGDVTAALAAADVQRAATYMTAYVAHVPLEPRAALAEWSGGRLTVWTGTQRPFRVREELAEALGVALADVRVMVPPTGSGFGGKHPGPVAAEAARLARAAGRPVKVQWTREEEFTGGYFRPAAVIDVAAGASESGALTAWDFINFNSGAAGIGMPYQVANRRIAFQPAQSPLPQGSYRALAATANNFARESHMDELAYALGVDPLEFRLARLADERLAAVLQAAAQRAGWERRAGQVGPAGARAGRGERDGPARRGLGIACGIEKDGRVATCAEVSVTAAGRLDIHRIVTAYECGAVVNPDNVANQIEGATVMALGGALFEAVHFDDGVILNASLPGYRVPRFSDVPPIDVVLLDRRDHPPAGAGEAPLIAVAPALANAIFAAAGRRIRSMPLLPDGALPQAAM